MSTNLDARDARLRALADDVAAAAYDERGILTLAESDLLAEAARILRSIPDLDR